MRKIFLGLVFLVCLFTQNLYSQSHEEGYCYDKEVYNVHKLGNRFPNYKPDYESKPLCTNRIPKSVYDKIDAENDAWFKKGAIKDPDAGFFSNAPLRDNPSFIRQLNNIE